MKTLQKLSLLALTALTLTSLLSSCATIFDGHITSYQKRKPLPGEAQRELRVGAFVADVLLFWPGLGIDFATGAIYKPQPAGTALAPVAAPSAPATAAHK